MIDHLHHPSLRSRWGDKRDANGSPVISVVVPRSSAGLDQCGSMAIFRLRREGTDPASRGLVWSGGGSRAAGGKT